MLIDPREQKGRYAKSWNLHQRARQLIPGGGHLSGRPLTEPGTSPLFFERARGCRIWDVDGHEYIDYLLAYGPQLLGYAHPEIDRAAIEQIERGSLLSLNTPMGISFVEALLARFAPAEMAVFLKTGSEATTAAIRIARRATGRRKVARCGYHGWHDWCLPLEPFVSDGLADQILEYSGRDPSTLERLFVDHDDIAAVILSPEMIYPQSRAAILQLQSVTRARGAVFIMDEVKTAFRSPGGSIQRQLGIQPDLTTLSKALGNGWPIAAVVGSRAVMSAAEGLHISATYHGDTAAMAAGMAVLDFLDRHPVADHVNALGQKLIDGLNRIVAQTGVPATAYAEPIPAMPFLRFNADPATNEALKQTFYGAMFDRGVLFHPRHMWFLSWAHRESDVDATLLAAEQAMAETSARHSSLIR